MVSLRSNLINARSGPGSRYPIEWIYKQKNAPVEIVAEFELWRKIKDWEGSETWVHKAMLVNKRWIKMTKPGTANVYAKPQNDSRVIAKVEDQVIGKVEKCPEQKDFCLIRFSAIEGWVNRNDFYGIYPGEVIN
jgi:SH3-like domain-containing protein